MDHWSILFNFIDNIVLRYWLFAPNVQWTFGVNGKIVQRNLRFRLAHFFNFNKPLGWEEAEANRRRAPLHMEEKDVEEIMGTEVQGGFWR